MTQVRGVPEQLDAYTADTLPALDRVRAALGDYTAAVAAFNAAEPNDLDSHVVDLSDAVLGSVDALEVLDRVPSAFAAALRDLDADYDPDAQGPALPLTADADSRLRRLLLDGVAGHAASGAERARVAQVLHRFDAVPDAPAPVVDITRGDDWRGALNQFTRHAGNAASLAHGSRRLTALRARYPVSHDWFDPAGWKPRELARAGGIHNRSVLHAARRAEEASIALRGTRPLLPTLGVHIPPHLLRAGKAAGNTVGAVGALLTVADTYEDIQDHDWGGVVSNSLSLAGSGLLLLTGGPITMTVGAVFVVGSMIYEANREEIDAMARRLGESMSSAARAVGDAFDF